MIVQAKNSSPSFLRFLEDEALIINSHTCGVVAVHEFYS